MALKALPLILAQDEQRMGRFEREADILVSLNHLSIASIYGMEEALPAARQVGVESLRV